MMLYYTYCLQPRKRIRDVEKKRITSTYCLPCPLGLLKRRDWIDGLTCLTQKSRLAARATDTDLFHGLKCPWYGVTFYLHKQGCWTWMLTYFGCPVVHSIANNRSSIPFRGNRLQWTCQKSRIHGIPSSWWHMWHRPQIKYSYHQPQMKTTNPTMSLRTWLFFGERPQVSEPPLPGPSNGGSTSESGD